MRPIAIRLYSYVFAASCLLSLGLAWRAASVTDFGFPLTDAAAHTLATRILYVRLAGVTFALWLMAMVVFGHSRAARGALVARWFLGIVTSIAFLRGIGVLHASASVGMPEVTVSLVQLLIESVAIMILFGDDAADWFDRRPAV